MRGKYNIEKMITVMIVVTAAKAVCFPYFADMIKMKSIIAPKYVNIICTESRSIEKMITNLSLFGHFLALNFAFFFAAFIFFASAFYSH